MPRSDLSNELIHWIKGDSDEEAFEVLLKIAQERRLLGGNGYIRDGYVCVCFTEAPETMFHEITGRYRPFGIRVSKRWVNSEGGRPVIYQCDSEYDQLNECNKWRHVRYEPNSDPPIDFTWEREWRIRTQELNLLPGEARIIVPDEDWADILVAEHLTHEEQRIQLEAMNYGELYSAQSPDPFYYPFSVIDTK